MSNENLQRYESEAELRMYEEYRDVLPLFKYAVDTERRYYLANEVSVTEKERNGAIFFEVVMTDAWVWDMYRPARFLKTATVLSFRDVNVETLEESNVIQRFLSPMGDTKAQMCDSKAAPQATHIAVGRMGERVAEGVLVHHGRSVLARNLRLAQGEIDLVTCFEGVRCLVEVKALVGTADPFLRLDQVKRARLRKLAHSIGAGSVEVMAVNFLAGGVQVRWFPL